MNNLQSIKPTNIMEAVMLLISEIPSDEHSKILGDPFAHMSIWRWSRNNWHLWWTPKLAEIYDNYPKEEPPLIADLTRMGFTHGDDRSSVIADCVVAKLSNGNIRETIISTRERFVRHWYKYNVNMETNREFEDGEKPATVEEYVQYYNEKFPVDEYLVNIKLVASFTDPKKMESD